MQAYPTRSTRLLLMNASIWLRSILLTCLALLTACSPKLDWREVHESEAGYSIMMPARPTIATRVIDLDGIPVSMRMTVAEADGLTFAVGSALMPNANQAQASLHTMKSALIRNIQGTVIEERTLSMPYGPGGNKGSLTVFHLHAKGAASSAINGQPRGLQARFVAVGNRVSQVIVTGPEEKLTRDVTDVYFSSLQLN